VNSSHSLVVTIYRFAVGLASAFPKINTLPSIAGIREKYSLPKQRHQGI
jgi:hypothetical protein